MSNTRAKEISIFLFILFSPFFFESSLIACAPGMKCAVDFTLHFDRNQTQPQKKDFKLMDYLIPYIKKYVPEFKKLRIEGYADAQEKSPQKLSEKRSLFVRDYLIGQGMDPSQLKTVGYGDSRPKGSSMTEEGRAQNRRVGFGEE